MNRCACLVCCVALLAGAGVAAGESTVSPVRKFAWGENIGWTNWRDANAGQQGARNYRTLLGGFVWGENVGWINLGSPANAVAGSYANTTGLNFGVNVDQSTGVCSGYAWGENIGWVNFNTTPSVGAQGARYDWPTGRFTGYAWGENIGWINLNDANAFVCSLPGDLNADGAVNTLDLTTFLGSFGQPIVLGTRGDFNADGAVNTIDLTFFLGQFGKTCP